MKKLVLSLAFLLTASLSFAQNQCGANFTSSLNNGVGTFNATNIVAPGTVGSVIAYIWSFGDGTTQTTYVPTVTHTYNVPGVPIACISIMDSAGFCTPNNNSWCDSVGGNPGGNPGNPCMASFAVANQDTLYTFTPVSSNAVAPFTYYWRIFDTINNVMLYSGNAVNPTVIIPVGTYAMVTLWVSDSTGCVASTGYTPVGLNNTGSSLSCNAFFYLFPDTTALHNYWGYNISTGANLQYVWNWGDGSTSNTAYPTHTYASAGFYTICLTVYGPNNCVDSMCIPYYIYRGASSNSMHTVSILNPASGIPAANQININIAPNPASEVLNWTISNAQVNAINIYSVNGMLVQHSIPSNTRLDISNLNTGLYLIEFTTNKGIVRSRFVKN